MPLRLVATCNSRGANGCLIMAIGGLRSLGRWRQGRGWCLDGVQMQKVTLLGEEMVVSWEDGAANRRAWWCHY